MIGEKNNDYPVFMPGIVYKRLGAKEILDKVVLAKDGDQQAYQDILCHLHSYICKITTEFYIQGSDIQDVYQECAIKLLNVIECFDSEKGNFVSFAQSSIRRHIITSINKEMAKKRTILNNTVRIEDDNDNESFTSTRNRHTTSKIGNPLDLIQRDYEEFLIEEISKVLSEMERKVFVLRFIKGLSYKDTAKSLGLYKNGKKRELDTKSVDNAIWRSRPKIKAVLESLNICPKKLKVKKSKKEKKNGANNKIQARKKE